MLFKTGAVAFACPECLFYSLPRSYARKFSKNASRRGRSECTVGSPIRPRPRTAINFSREIALGVGFAA